MSRVELLAGEQAPLLVRHLYGNGDPGPIVAALAQVPEILEVTAPFLNAALGAGALGSRLKELVILRTSALLDCRYCVDTHSVVAIDTGLSAAEVRCLREVPRGHGWPEFTEPDEQAALAWIDEVAGGVGPISAEAADRLARHFRDFEVVELGVTLGATMLLNRFCTALELPVSAETRAGLVDAGLS